MSTCGYWAHCAYHCDLSCDHKEWCPGFPAAGSRTNRLSAWLRQLADHLEN